MTEKGKKEKGKGVYGRSLEELFQETGLVVPLIVCNCITFLKEYPDALITEGLFRISPPQSQVLQIKEACQSPLEPINLFLITNDPHVVACSLKQFFSDLPEPLFPFSFYEDMVAAFESEERTPKIKAKVAELPICNRFILSVLFSFLTEVCQFTEQNKMTTENVGVCFGPNLLRPEVVTTKLMMDKYDSRITQWLIENYLEVVYMDGTDNIVASQHQAGQSMSKNKRAKSKSKIMSAKSPREKKSGSMIVGKRDKAAVSSPGEFRKAQIPLEMLKAINENLPVTPTSKPTSCAKCGGVDGGLRDCAVCHKFYCLRCSGLSGFENPCSNGIAHLIDGDGAPPLMTKPASPRGGIRGLNKSPEFGDRPSFPSSPGRPKFSPKPPLSIEQAHFPSGGLSLAQASSATRASPRTSPGTSPGNSSGTSPSPPSPQRKHGDSVDGITVSQPKLLGKMEIDPTLLRAMSEALAGKRAEREGNPSPRGPGPGVSSPVGPSPVGPSAGVKGKRRLKKDGSVVGVKITAGENGGNLSVLRGPKVTRPRSLLTEEIKEVQENSGGSMSARSNRSYSSGGVGLASDLPPPLPPSNLPAIAPPPVPSLPPPPPPE